MECAYCGNPAQIEIRIDGVSTEPILTCDVHLSFIVRVLNDKPTHMTMRRIGDPNLKVFYAD